MVWYFLSQRTSKKIRKGRGSNHNLKLFSHNLIFFPMHFMCPEVGGREYTKYLFAKYKHLICILITLYWNCFFILIWQKPQKKKWPRFFLASKGILFQMVCAWDRMCYLIKKFFLMWITGGSLGILSLVQSLKNWRLEWEGGPLLLPPILLNQILVFAGSVYWVIPAG